MALGDCPKCWDHTCTCGYEYCHRNVEGLATHLAMISQYRSKEEVLEALERAKEIVKMIPQWKDKE